MRQTTHKIILAGVLALGLLATASAQLPTPLYAWRCASGDSAMNFNPATMSATHFDSLPYAGSYTVVAVYKPVADSEATVWSMQHGDGTRSLGTGRILVDSVSIIYESYGDLRPVVSTLRQSAPDSVSPFSFMTVGGQVMTAEMLYYGGRLGNAALRRVQSLLALRYGITLGPVDYLDGAGNAVWDYADSGLYHHRVTGVGRDTLSGLYQPRSRSGMYGSMLTISSDSLRAGSYLVAGDDDGPLAFSESDGVELLGRTWRMLGTRAEGVPVTLAFDLGSLPLPRDSITLLVGATAYLPTSLTAFVAEFDGVVFPGGETLFTIGRGTGLWEMAAGGGRRKTLSTVTNAVRADIYPNPSAGRYTIEVGGAENVRVTIHNIHGAVVATHSGSGGNSHSFQGELPQGVYFATVETGTSSQTLKLVVR